MPKIDKDMTGAGLCIVLTLILASNFAAGVGGLGSPMPVAPALLGVVGVGVIALAVVWLTGVTSIARHHHRAVAA